jgi:hypothetical protein
MRRGREHVPAAQAPTPRTRRAGAPKRQARARFERMPASACGTAQSGRHRTIAGHFTHAQLVSTMSGAVNWRCIVCTLHNPAASSSCGVCGAVRADDEEVVFSQSIPAAPLSRSVSGSGGARVRHKGGVSDGDSDGDDVQIVRSWDAAPSGGAGSRAAGQPAGGSMAAASSSSAGTSHARSAISNGLVASSSISRAAASSGGGSVGASTLGAAPARGVSAAGKARGVDLTSPIGAFESQDDGPSSEDDDGAAGSQQPRKRKRPADAAEKVSHLHLGIS